MSAIIRAMFMTFIFALAKVTAEEFTCGVATIAPVAGGIDGSCTSAFTLDPNTLASLCIAFENCEPKDFIIDADTEYTVGFGERSENVSGDGIFTAMQQNAEMCSNSTCV